MYRLSIIQCASTQSMLFQSWQRIIQRPERTCSFCNFHHHRIMKHLPYFQVRNKTTTTNLMEQCSSTQKKKKRKLKKYVELLEVTDKKASNKKTAVHKLNARNLSILADESGTARDKSNEEKHSVPKENKMDGNVVESVFPNNETINKVVSSYTTSVRSYREPDDEDHINIYKESQNDMIEYDRMSQDEKVTNSESPKEKNKQKSKYASDEYLKKLLSYMHVYLNCGVANVAHRSLMLFRKTMKSRSQSLRKHISIYNILLEKYASSGAHDKVLELYNFIKDDSVLPNPQSYGYIFDSFGRKDLKNYEIEFLKKIEQDMRNNNISYDDIFIKGELKSSQERNVLKAIKILQPTFKMPCFNINNEYECHLLKNVNTVQNYQSPIEDVVTLEELQAMSHEQIKNEYLGEMEVENIDVKNSDNSTVLENRQKVEDLEQYWKKVALTAFERNLQYLKKKEQRIHNSMLLLSPFFEVLEKENYVNAILREVRNLAQTSELFSMPLSYLFESLGRQIYNNYEMKMYKKTGLIDYTTKVYSKYIKWLLERGQNEMKNINHRLAWNIFENEEEKVGLLLNGLHIEWDRETFKAIGKFLYNIILNDIILTPNILKTSELQHSVPAFYTLFRNGGVYLVEQIKPHPFVSKVYRESQQPNLIFPTNLIPSVSPSRPWCSVSIGGYIIMKSRFIRLPSVTLDATTVFKTVKPSKMYPIIDSLNQLGSIPWKINCPILDIVIKIFQEGGSAELDIPQSPSAVFPQTTDESPSQEEDVATKQQLIRRRRAKADMYSLWCDALYRLSLANYFRDKVFWLPHSVDFRGRVYPIPPHLSHLGPDVARSLLLFAQGKPLGKNGLNWLKIHVINLTGKKKGCSNEERLEYANEHLDDILDSAENPLTGKMWWKTSDEPWQTLASCMEIANILKSPDPEKYLSRFPIHQDGSCNGLQHYAALGRDQQGAESVNLYPFNMPQDVYSAVVVDVEKHRKSDAENNIEIAKALDGFVKRKVIKQTVMTTVYGVTKFGAKRQIWKQLRDMEDFPQKLSWEASLYLTEKTFQSLRTMFKSARDIQDWFTMCARIIAANNKKVQWLTPLGFPVIQLYMKTLGTSQGKKIIDTMKQKNAFPPNFIHSLDSTHMMLTSLHCERAGISFVAVHDCFWTHAVSVDAMNKICREQFVALHSEPILENLSKYFIEHYTSEFEGEVPAELMKTFRAIPATGTFDIKSVLSSVYFFN